MDSARRIALFGMVMSGLLAIMKLTVGWLAHSASLSADGFESTADVFASALVFIALTLAERPPDENHPYGHGRVETLAGLLLGFLLMAAGWGIAWHGLTGAADEKRVPASYAVWPLVISMAVKFVLVAVKFRKARQIDSDALKADATNDAIDLFSAMVALGALSLTLYDPAHFLRADHYGAALVGLIVIATSLRIMYESAMHLMDTMPDEGAMRQIRQVAVQVPEVAGVEKCFARKTGLKYHVDLHLEVDPEISVRHSHEIATNVRIAIKEALPWVADVLVHVEPAPN